MMLQFLVDLARKQQFQQQQQQQQRPDIKSDDIVVGIHQHHHHCKPDNKPAMVRSPSSASSIETWPILDDDWHDDKQCWSFKDDYVSFPSLEDDNDDHAITTTSTTASSTLPLRQKREDRLHLHQL